MNQLFDLSGKNVLITGSSKGIGKAIARHMALQGANVVISSRKGDICEQVAEEINAEGIGRAVAIPCNISHKEQLQMLVTKTRELLGSIHSLVCNAAVNPYYGPSADISDEAFDKILGVNVRSNHWLCNLVLPEMAERQDGTIIIVSSIAAFHGSTVLGAYGISKAADLALVRNIAVEYGPMNIRANAICPGLVKTDFARALWENPETLKMATQGSPLRRIGEPDEIAGAALLMASAAGAFMTGQVITIDGGRCAA